MVRRMQINTAADRLHASLETKKLRRSWNPDLHPRDSKGRFIETGGIARMWGGGMARVLRALGGRDVLVENLSTHQRSTVNAGRLTMVTRPDGTAPTRSKKKVKDEDARRLGDEDRGHGGKINDGERTREDGRLPGDDAGDEGRTPDEPHDKDDVGAPIGDDVEGQDHGAGPEPEDDDDLLAPQGRVMPNDKDDEGDPLPSNASRNSVTRQFQDLLPITNSFDGRRSRHVTGNGDALRAAGPLADEHHGRFWDTSHARRAMNDLSEDYFADLQSVWPADWNNDDARRSYDALDDRLWGPPVDISDDPKDQLDQGQVDELEDLAQEAEDLADLAERDGRDDVVRYAQNLADALNLAHNRLTSHDGKPIPKPAKKRKKDQPLVPRAWRPTQITPSRVTATPSQQRQQRAKKQPTDNRRFKTLADVRQHWASGELTPFTDDKDRQERHTQAVRQVFAKLQNPQMSKGGTFVVAKTTVPRADGTPETRYVIDHIATGGQLTSFARKAEATDFANRLENAQVDGKPFDWDSPGLNDRLQEEGAKQEFGRLLAETEKAYDAKARKKRGGGMRQQPAPAPSPESAVAREITDRSGAPEGTVAVGHVGPTQDTDRAGARTQPKPEDEQQNGDEKPTPERPAIPAGEATNDDDDTTPRADDDQPGDNQEEQQGESVRRAGEGVLGDVPADGAGGDSGDGEGGVLHPDRRGSRDGDRRDVPGPRSGSGAGRGAGRGRAQRSDSDGEAEGPRSGDGRAGVPGQGAGDGDEGPADDQVPADDHRVAFGSSREEETAAAFTPPTDGRSLVPSTVQARVRANIAAIEVLRRLEDEKRPATPAEQDTLSRWSGWGATPQVFVDDPKAEFAPLQARIKELLSEDEYASAKENTLNAHYTDPAIVQGVWQALKELGFDGGDVLEPGSGSGNFIGYAPDGARMTGVELDPITAGISKALYPHADIRREGFEKTRVPDGTYDMAVGNVPFGDYKVVDLRHNKGGHNIHNHFILKSLDLTRPGGLVAVVTSRYTMDGATARAEDARMEMARKGELVGAIRLPSGAHRRTAGTDVVTDLLIFRRRDKDKDFTTGRDRTGAVKKARGKDDPPAWVHTQRVTDLPGQTPPGQNEDLPLGESVFVNPYFLNNRDRVLGEMAVGSGMYRDGELRVDGDGHLEPAIDKALKKVVADAKAEGLAYKKDNSERPKAKLLPPGSDRIDGHVQAEDDGTFTQVRDGQIRAFHVPATQVEEVRQLLGLRDSMKALITEEARPDADEQVIAMLRADFNARYDKYHAKHGALNRYTWGTRKATNPVTGETVEKATKKRPQMGGLMAKDPTMSVVLSLDTFDEATGNSSKASIFTKRQAVHRTISGRADSPEDAMALVLEEHSRLDDESLGKVLGLTPEDARARLLEARSKDPDSGKEWPLVFEPHEGGDLIPAADYLSGNVRAKLNEAQQKAGEDRRFEVNVRHLEEVLPPEISPGEIDAPMGASWIGGEAIQQFLQEILRDRSVRVHYQGSSLWKVEAPDGTKKGSAATSIWGTKQWNAIKLAEAILTNGRIQVRIKPEDGPSYVDEEATAAAQAKAEEMRERFQDWLWEDPQRAEAIKKAYNDTHNNLALRSYDGQRRTLPGLAEWFKPHAHQHSAVARMVNEPAVLLAHEVGAGKTAEMTMGVMELRRLGLINKAAMVVPGHMLQQFHDEFVELYPQSAGRILTASSDDLQGRKRREFIARAATGDWDAVILTQNAFESIQMRPEAQLAYIKREKESLERAMARQKTAEKEDGKAGRSESRMVKEIQKKLKNLEAKIEQKIAASKDAAGLYFEDTGIDYVVVDEAHHYKNLATSSSIPGAAIEGSNRASDLDMKLEYLRSKTKSGRVVTFATATPISNSVTEAHTMLRYLRPDLLDKARIRDFDEFASTYGKIVSGVELAADGSGFKEVSRFAAFRNMPELLRIWRTVADVKTAEDLNLDVPDVVGGKAITITVEPSDGQMQYQQELAARARAVKEGRVEPTEDNMLKISSDGRKVSLDPRMVGIDEIGNKLPAAADNIHRIYEQTKDAVYPTSKNDDTPHDTPGGLQIVFLDMGTPKDPGRKKKGKKNAAPSSEEEMAQSDFAAYDELKTLLVDRGVPAEKIRFIHEAKNDAEKARLFDDARTGKIAVLLGSTTKMGTGTNVQLRATALHHLDCPWRPADLEQRNGRIIRQGNANPAVAIFQYVTEQSFDGFSWQTVARKAKFIRQIMKGNLTDRTVEDIPDGVFNPEQVTAMATGNAYLLEQANVRASLAILQRKFKGYIRAREGFKSTILGAERLREQTDKLVKQLLDVAERKKDTRGDNFNATIGTKTFTKRQDAMAALATAAKAVIRNGDKEPYATHQPHVIGKVGDIEVTAQYKRDWSRPYGQQGTAIVSMPDVPYSSRTYGEDEIDANGITPITRLEDSLANVEADIARAESRLRVEERNAEDAKLRVDRPFDQADELAAAERRSKLVTAAIREQSREPSSPDDAAYKRARMEEIEHNLREARIAAGEDPADADDPAQAQDTDLLPQTPAPPSINTDAKGNTRITWPDKEARKKRRAREKAERNGTPLPDEAESTDDETALTPDQVRADLGSLREDSESAPEPGDRTEATDTPSPATDDVQAPADGNEETAEDTSDGDDEGTTTLDPEQVRADLNSLRDEDSDNESAAEPDRTQEAQPPAPADAPQAEPAPAAADETTAPGDGSNDQTAPEPEQPADTTDDDLPAQGEQVLSPDGPGEVMAVNADTGSVLVRAERGTRVHALKDVTRPDGTPFGGNRTENTKEQQNAERIAQASTHEGAELSASTGNRLRDLDMEAGTGTIVDRDGNTIGWVRARIGDDGRRYWWGQDADGGSPHDMQWHEELPAQAGAPPIRAAGVIRDGIDRAKFDGGRDENGQPSKVKRRLITPDRAITEMTLTSAQVRELGKLTLSGTYADGKPIDTLPWDPGHRRYSPYSAQAGAIAAAAREAAAQTPDTPEGRRSRKVLLGAARKMERQQYDSARRAASIPAPGEPDPYDKPYVPRPEDEDTDTPETPSPTDTAAPDTVEPVSTDAPDTTEDTAAVAPEPFANDAEWRRGLVDLDAAEGQVNTAASNTWTNEQMPGGIPGLRRALFDAIAAQEDNDFDTAADRLAAARKMAAGLLDTLDDRERASMEGPLRGFIALTDDYLARHQATRKQRDTEDAQAQRIEEEAGEQVRRTLRQPSSASTPEAPANPAPQTDADESSAPDAPEPVDEPASPDTDTPQPAQYGDGEPAPNPNTTGWKGPDETRETVGERDGKPVEVGETYTNPSGVHYRTDETRRAVYLGGERIGSIHQDDTAWHAEHDQHGSLGWLRPDEVDNPTQDAAMLIAAAHGEPLLSFPRDRGDYARANDIREWAGVWAQPQPDGVNNVFLNRALAHNGYGWMASTDPWGVRQWISTMADVEPLAQYDENTRRSLDEVPAEARQFLADLAEDLRSSVREMGEELRADLRPMLRDHIATRSGRKKALELRSRMAEERVQKARDAVRERIARARAGAAEHGLTEQQAEDFLTSVVGGDSTDQVTYGIRGEYPEALRPLSAAAADAGAYWAAFAGWATVDDRDRWAGMHWDNGRRESINAPMSPAADPRTGTGDIKIGEAELPKGMRWARGADLQQGDIFHSVKHPRRGTTDIFDGMEPPQYVVHMHRNGVEGRVRSVSLDSDRGGHDPGPDDHVIIVENPEASVRKRARHRARTDINLGWNVPEDDEALELGGPERVKALVARAEVTAVDKDEPGLDRLWTVRVDGVEVGRIDNTDKVKVLEYVSETPDGQRRVWHGKDLATAGLVVAHDARTGRDEREETADRDEQDDREERDDDQGEQDVRQPDADRGEGEGPGERDGGGGELPDGGTGVPESGGNDVQADDVDIDTDDNDSDNDDEDQDERRRRRRRRDRNRPNGAGGGAPNGGGPGMPNLPGDRDRGGRGDDDDRGTSPDLDGPGPLDGLKDRYRTGNVTVPRGADEDEHKAFLRGLAENDTLTLSPGGGLITWSDDDGRTWEFGHAASGLRFAHWEANGDEIGGRDGARNLAGAYEGLRDDQGNFIDWASPELDEEQLRAWRDAEGRSLPNAVERARQNAVDAHRRDPSQADGQPIDDGTADASTPDNSAELVQDRDDASQGDPTTATTPADTSASAESDTQDADGTSARSGDVAASPYIANSSHGPGKDRAGTVDGRRIPTNAELEQYETRGSDEIISEEGERALFGSPEQMQEPFDEAFVPGPVMRSDENGQVWRNGRLIGNLFAPHKYAYGERDEVWWSRTPFSAQTHFATREAAIANLVLRDKERGEPDLSIVHPDHAWHLGIEQGLAFDGLRGLESLEDNPKDLERYRALRRLLAQLANGETSSGNVADDLGHLHDELRWLDATHYKQPKTELKQKNVLGPGWLADKITEALDVLRPEDPRANHHEARKNRAAHQYLDELKENGGLDRAVPVESGEIREGDIVHLDGRATGHYAGYTTRQTGYVVGTPTKATLTTNGKRQKAWRITVSPDPWELTRHQIDTNTFIIPVTEGGLRLARAEDINLPFDEHFYGRRVGQTPQAPDTDSTPSRPERSATPDVPGTDAPAAGSDGGTSAPATAQNDRTAPAPAQDAPEAAETPRAPEPDVQDEQRADDTAPDKPRRRGEQQPARDESAPEPDTEPEPVGGRRAEWVQASDLAVGDLVRIDGITKRGTARTLAGFVVDGPKQVSTERSRRVQNMQRLLIADTPDGRDGKRQSIWVPMDATAARATDDEIDTPDGAPATGADSDILTGRIADRVPTDASGRGLFPGSIVTDSRGREGTVTGANDSTVSVRWGDDRDDEEMSPSALTLTDSGAARPSGWTEDGDRVRPGQVVTDRSGTLLGTVEEVDGDTATIATPDGMRDTPISDVRVAGGVTNTPDTAPQPPRVASTEPTTVGELAEGDVIVHNGPQGTTTGKVVSRTDDGDHVQVGIADTATGEIQQIDTTPDAPTTRALDDNGGAPDLGPGDAPDTDELTSHEPLPAVDPVVGDTVDPNLAPEERDAVADLGEAPLDDPDAQQGAARVGGDLPLTPGQATALAGALRDHNDTDTPEGRAAHRAAGHLDEAAGQAPEPVTAPEPGTIGTVGVGDHISLPDENDPDTVSSYKVVGIAELPGGIRELTLEDGDGLRTTQVLAAADPLWQVPEPDAPTPDTDEARDPNPAPDPERIANDYLDAVVRAVIDSAVDGTTEAGSIHVLRQQIAERLTPQALMKAMREAREEAKKAIDAAGITGDERAELLRKLRPEAARVRQDAVKAALRTLNDLEPKDGESEEDLSRRAADLLRLIPAALRDKSSESGDPDANAKVDDAVTTHVDDAVGDALGQAGNGQPLTEERRKQIVAQLAAQMAATRNDTAQQIAGTLPPGQRAGVLPHIVAALVFIARKIVAIVAAFLRGIARAWRSGREALRTLREKIARFRRRLMDRIRSWPENRRLRRLAALSLPQPEDGSDLSDRLAHWTRLMPAPGRFGQVSRRTRWYLPTRRSTLEAGQLPPVQDGLRWMPDRAADRGPGSEALRHLAALRAAGTDVDSELSARLAVNTPELGADPHRTVRDAMDYAAVAERRLRDLTAAAATGADTDGELDAARVEAQGARRDAVRIRGLYADSLPSAVRDVLAQVREMGPQGTAGLIVSDDSDPDAARILNDMQQFVPRDWLAPAGTRMITARRGEAGGYDAHSRTATVADLGDDGRATAIHALLTHLQRSNPDVLAAQEVYHFVRTHRGRVGARRTTLDALLARLFQDQASQGHADGIAPQALATLFSGEWYLSDDLRAFLLGLLATR